VLTSLIVFTLLYGALAVIDGVLMVRYAEPTAHLDAATADALAAEIMATTVGRTALIVTHRPEQTPSLPEVHLPRPTAIPRIDCREVGPKTRRPATQVPAATLAVG
jgi:hypothetical protein